MNMSNGNMILMFFNKLEPILLEMFYFEYFYLEFFFFGKHISGDNYCSF